MSESAFSTVVAVHKLNSKRFHGIDMTFEFLCLFICMQHPTPLAVGLLDTGQGVYFFHLDLIKVLALPQPGKNKGCHKLFSPVEGFHM